LIQPQSLQHPAQAHSTGNYTSDTTPEYDQLIAFISQVTPNVNDICALRDPLESINWVKRVTLNSDYLNGFIFGKPFQMFSSCDLSSALLFELHNYCLLLDTAPSSVREYVWRQVFAIVGIDVKNENSLNFKNLFSPIIKAWLSEPTLNLQAIEILYLAIAESFIQQPQLLTQNFATNNSNRLNDNFVTNNTTNFSKYSNYAADVHKYN